MSIFSFGRRSLTSSTPSLIRNKYGTASNAKKSITIDENIVNILIQFLETKNKKDEYLNLINKLGESYLSDDNLMMLIGISSQCLSLLNTESKLFVKLLLTRDWLQRSDAVIAAYKNFIINICSAHNYYTRFALGELVAMFSNVITHSLQLDHLPSEQEEKCFKIVHDVIRIILKLVPMSKGVLGQIMANKFPYIKNEFNRGCSYYVKNILVTAMYEPYLKRTILTLVITKLLRPDTMSSKEEIERAENESSAALEVDELAMDVVDDDEKDLKLNIAKIVDHSIFHVLMYIKSYCFTEKGDELKLTNAKELYDDLMYIFDEHIVKTDCTHLHFIILYMISQSKTFITNFLRHLWSITMNPNFVCRENAVRYLVGTLSHLSFVDYEQVKFYMRSMTLWLHKYIENCSTVDEDEKEDSTILIRKHLVFYSVSQCLFYLIISRHMDLMDDTSYLKFLTDLNIGYILMSPLKPLSMCCSNVVNPFIKLIKDCQLSYCAQVSKDLPDDTSELWLKPHLPFSVFLLKRCNEMIEPILRIPTETIHANSNEYDLTLNEEEFIPHSGMSYSPAKPCFLGISPNMLF